MFVSHHSGVRKLSPILGVREKLTKQADQKAIDFVRAMIFNAFVRVQFRLFQDTSDIQGIPCSALTENVA